MSYLPAVLLIGTDANRRTGPDHSAVASGRRRRVGAVFDRMGDHDQIVAPAMTGHEGAAPECTDRLRDVNKD
jgi:hypothetical protein